MSSSTRRREVEDAILQVLDQEGAELIGFEKTGGCHCRVVFSCGGAIRSYVYAFSSRGHLGPQYAKSQVRKIIRGVRHD